MKPVQTGIAFTKANNAQVADKVLREHSVHFTRDEVDNLLFMFIKIATDPEKSKIERMKFREVLHNVFGMTDDIVMDRVFRAFDKDNDSFINKEEWLKGMSVFLKGTLEEQASFCFDVYDINSDKQISRDEMFHMLKFCLQKQPNEEDPDEGVKDLVDTVLKKMDIDKDNRLNFEDYRKSVVKEPLLLEVFGPCLPEDKVKKRFLQRIQSHKRKLKFTELN